MITMKRLIFCLVVLSLLSVAAFQAQTRQVKDQVLTSTYLPPIRIKFDDQFKYVGTQKFIFYPDCPGKDYSSLTKSEFDMAAAKASFQTAEFFIFLKVFKTLQN